MAPGGDVIVDRLVHLARLARDRSGEVLVDGSLFQSDAACDDARLPIAA